MISVSEKHWHGAVRQPRQQHRIRAVHGVGTVHHGAFQRTRLHRNVLGEELRQRNIALRIAGAFAEIASPMSMHPPSVVSLRRPHLSG